MSDLKFAFRQLCKNPGFTTVAVLTLALGIGANTAIFTVINALLLRSLPVEKPEELVQISTASASGQLGYAFSYPGYEQLREGGRSLSGLFAASGVGVKDRLVIPNNGNAEVEFVRAQAVSGNFFSVLGVSAMIGRLSTGVQRRQAEAELAVIYEHYRDAYAVARGANWTPEQRRFYLAGKLKLEPGHAGWTNLRAQSRDPLLILMAVVGTVLLIACANVVSLLFARAAARQREFSVRRALGAGRLRLMRQLLTESLLLAALGGLAGLVLAEGATGVLQAIMRLQSDPISFRVEPDVRVLLFTGAVSLLTGLLFGLAPAFRGSQLDLASTLKGTAGGVAGGALRQRPLQLLVVVQVALALVLLISAGLFVRTLRNLKGLDAGFTPENVVLFNLDFAQPLDTKRWTALYKELLVRLEAMPGVRAASLFSNGYLSGNSWTDRVSAEGVADPDENLECAITRVGPRFFETFGTRLLAGREFGAQDERPVNSNSITPGTAVINQAMARLYFGDANPLGKRFYLTHQPEQKFEIVGVVPDAKYRSLRDASPPMLYLPYFWEVHNIWANFALRTAADPRPTMADLRSVVRAENRSVRVRDVRTMNDMVNGSVHQERLIAQLGGFFSVFALALASLGLYGVLSFAVVHRTREIGVRMALGAHNRQVLALVIGQGMRLALTGVIIGLLAALAMTRAIRSLLYEVKPADPATFVGVSLMLLAIALFACWLPARHASRVDPMEALRCE